MTIGYDESRTADGMIIYAPRDETITDDAVVHAVAEFDEAAMSTMTIEVTEDAQTLISYRLIEIAHAARDPRHPAHDYWKPFWDTHHVDWREQRMIYRWHHRTKRIGKKLFKRAHGIER